MSFQPLGLSGKTDYALLASNILTIILALVFDWGLLTVMWIYWLQSVTIGIFHFFKMLLSAISYKETPGYKTFTLLYKGFGLFSAFFFALHYGLFHFGYFAFLAIFSMEGVFGLVYEQVDYFGIFFIGAVFFANHALSFWEHEIKNKAYLNRHPMMMMFEPYVRIIPMHLTIIFGAFFIGFLPEIGKKIALVFFLGLKTLADLASHSFKHRKIEK